MNIKRKSLIVMILMVASVMGLAMQISPAQAQSNVLTVAVSDQQTNIVNLYASDFANSRSDVDSVNVVSTGSNADNQRQNLVTALSGGDLDYDVIHMDVIWTAEFAANGWLEELDYSQSFLDNYLDAHVEAMTYDDTIYASPFFFDAGLLLYRKDILARNGFSEDASDFETWSDFKTNLNKILDNGTEIDENPQLEGYVAQSDAYEGGVVNLVEWMGASGGTFLEDGEANFESAKPALKWWKSLIAGRYTTARGNNDSDAVMERSELVGDEGSAFGKWLGGNAVFQRNWPFSYLASLSDAFLNGTTTTSDWPADKARFGVTTLPYNSTLCDASCPTQALGGAVLAVPTDSDLKGPAKDFLEFAAAYDQQLEMFTEIGNLPAHEGIYQAGTVSEGGDIPNNLGYAVTFYENVFQNVIPRPVHPDYAAMSEAIQPLFHDAIGGARDIDSAVRLMNEEVNLILEEAAQEPTSTPGEVPGFTFIIIFFLGTTVVTARYLKRKKELLE